MITGDPAAVEGAAWVLADAGRDLADAAESVAGRGRAVTAYWTGAASEAASGQIDQLSRDVGVGAEVCAAGQDVLLTYAAELRAAQAAERDAMLAPLTPQQPTALTLGPPPGVAAAVARAAQADADAAAAIDALVERLTGVASTSPGTLPAPQVGPAPPEPPGDYEDAGWSAGDWGHLALDLAGLVPLVGEVADGANAAWYAAEGDMTNAALSGAAAVPGLGMAATLGKFTAKGVDVSKNLKGGEWVDGVNVLPPSGRTFVGTGRGTLYDVPPGWPWRLADNGKGSVYQRPGSWIDSNSIRIMEPTSRYPDGYVKVTNADNQPVDPFGTPGGKAEVHISQTYQGGWSAWPTE